MIVWFYYFLFYSVYVRGWTSREKASQFTDSDCVLVASTEKDHTVAIIISVVIIVLIVLVLIGLFIYLRVKHLW